MIELFAALSRSLRDLSRGEVLWHALWPPLLALALWATLGFAFWSDAHALMTRLLPQLPWTGWEWVARWAGVFLLLAALVALTYITATMLVAIFALPLLLRLVAQRDYPELGRHGENVFWASLGNTLAAGAIFLVGSLVLLPLLLIPGMLLVLPLLWAAWLNQRTFRFDALAEHATAAELGRIVGGNRRNFWLAGLVTAGAGYLPLVNLLVPAFTALVFVHLGLAALRRLRHEQGVQL
ncbi:MAG: EI24 domain-containing protein [Rhodocyclales bacterium]|nr:EI24 domain-containing protein [Rhodocyclales bacterium]